MITRRPSILIDLYLQCIRRKNLHLRMRKVCFEPNFLRDYKPPMSSDGFPGKFCSENESS